MTGGVTTKIVNVSAKDVLTSWATNSSVTIPVNHLYTGVITTTGTYSVPQVRRIKCKYCDCMNDKDYGKCNYCGAPLKE